MIRRLCFTPGCPDPAHAHSLTMMVAQYLAARRGDVWICAGCRAVLDLPTRNAQPPTKGPTEMTNDETTVGTPAGSNPAGVAQALTGNDSASPHRTEPRSVSAATDGQTARRPAPGDVLEALLPENGTGTDYQRVVFAKVSPHDPDKFVVVDADDLDHWGFSFDDEGNSWRWPQPEPRRCTVPVDQADGGECGAVLGSKLTCDVCGGARCFDHCKGIDHFGGRTVDQGGSGSLRWKIAEVAANRFQGQIWRSDRSMLSQIVETMAGYSVAELHEKLHARIALMAAQYEAPAVKRLEDAVHRRQELLQAFDRRLNLSRVAMLTEVIEWLRDDARAWDQMLVPDSGPCREVFRQARELHNRMVAGLFSRIGGAL
jgi:hypothetical protein